MISNNIPATVTLPPQHPDTFKQRAHNADTTMTPNQRAAGKPLGSVFQQVYCPNATHVVTLPAAAVEHMPKSGLHIKRLVLCAHHHSDLLHAASPAPAATSTTEAGAARPRCPKGGRCKYVHARVGVAEMRTMPRTQVHVNNAWRSLDDVEYERFPAEANGGRPVRVRCPDGGATCDAMEPQFMLRTKARLPDGNDPATATATNTTTNNNNNSSSTAPLRHCAHYYYGRECILGPDCAFVHAVYIDPRAGKNQRAPPAHLLKTRPGGVGDGSARPPGCTDHHQRRRVSDASSDSDGNNHHYASGSALGSPSGRSTASGGSEHCASGRFRHDPYSVASTRRCVRCELLAAAAAAGEAARDADAGIQ